MPSKKSKPRGERFATAEARVVWAGICALDEGDQQIVLGELRNRLALAEDRESPHEIRMARGVAALREAANHLEGKSPSVAEYRELRQAHPEYGWPADGSLRRWLAPTGGWNEALARARLDAVPESLAAAPVWGPELSEEEVLEAMRTAATELNRELQDLTFNAYLGWARDPEVRRRPGRRPASQYPFERHFGGWRKALARAIGGDEGEAEGRVAAGAAGQGYAYSDEELLRGLDEITQRVCPEGGFPRSTEYVRGRVALLTDEKSVGKPPRAIASYNVLQRRWRTWARVRHAYERWKESR